MDSALDYLVIDELCARHARRINPNRTPLPESLVRAAGDDMAP
jgi:hypothetical protein